MSKKKGYSQAHQESRRDCQFVILVVRHSNTNQVLVGIKKSKCGTAKLYQCPTCSKEFDRKDSLKHHISDGCKGSKPQQTACHRCGKEFQTNWHLERHSKTCREKCLHSKEKIEKHLADHVCNLIQVRAPVGRSRQRALNVKEN